MDDVFDVQERVAREIVAALGITLRPEEDRRLASRGIVHVAAFELYLEARDQMRRFMGTPATWNALIDRAVAIEGDVPVLRGLRLWGQLSLLKLGMGDRETLGAIEQRAHDIILVAPDGPWGYAALGYLAFERGEMQQAISWFRAAIARDPADMESRYWLTMACGYAGLFELGETSAAGLLSVDPVAPMSWMATAIPWFFGGSMPRALELLRQSLAMDPQSYLIRWTLAYAYMVLGDLEAADDQLEWIGRAAPDTPYTLQLLALQQALRGEHAHALAIVSALDVMPFDCHLTFHVAEVFAMAGDTDRGFELLALSVQRGFTPVAFIETHCPFIEPLRARAGFASVLAEAQSRSEGVRRGVMDVA